MSGEIPTFTAELEEVVLGIELGDEGTFLLACTDIAFAKAVAASARASPNESCFGRFWNSWGVVCITVYTSHNHARPKSQLRSRVRSTVLIMKFLKN